MAATNTFKLALMAKPVPPSPDDPVICLIARSIQHLKSVDITIANVGVRVYSATTSEPLWPQQEADKMTEYFYIQDHENILEKLFVSITAGHGPLTIDRVIIHKWLGFSDSNACHEYVPIPFKTWLTNLPLPNMKDGKFSYDHIWTWWKCTGKVFDIFALPAEIRELIYRHCLGQKLNLQSVQGRVVLGRGFPSFPDINLKFPNFPANYSARELIRESYDDPRVQPRMVFVDKPDLNLLRLNKQVRAEALHAVWTHTRKSFLDPSVLEDVLSCGNTPSFSWLRRIELNFGTFEYIEFFGLFWRPYRPSRWGRRWDRPQVAASCLQSMPTLEDLQICFDGPYVVQAYRVISLGCHKKVVDWILAGAFPFIKDIKTVKLTGCIKNSVKMRWDRILKIEYQERGAKEKSHDFDYERAKKILHFMQFYYIPFDCECRTPCDKVFDHMTFLPRGDRTLPEFDFE
ncbi:hypothetical protein EJ04DRAFT_574885 [Polyplosphaeria fusca]|uniref:Uncharacterized protein n=1 Tax=Polyplosphaeria fusca TaxID=682080 RepID=A0A9P4R596_9PLEO|nr:hypothetical protein EJ04DRAFT_574885 [Polyplosphaeria fusca]